MSSDAFRRPVSAIATGAVVALVLAAGVADLRAQRVPQAGTLQMPRFYPDDPIGRDEDSRSIPPVMPFDLSKSYEFVHETFGRSKPLLGPALNVNTLGEVPDSSWFINRIGRFGMSVDDLVRGPNTVDGPAPGIWHVTGRPDAGITPKFTIRDPRGDTYLIKLDPADFPELPSSVETISTKIFHALGYYVPEDYLVAFDESRLAVAPGAELHTETGARRPIDTNDVRQWLAHVPRRPDGTIRALASRYVPGRVVGQFRYTGTRSDDANDIYPHQRRRELRGLRVFAAWLNHDDARSINSIDTYVSEGGRSYVRHYLQDFGSNLGSGSTSAQQPRGGNEYLIEGGKIARALAAFGLWTRPWAHVRYPRDPSIGNIEADFFEPSAWKTEYPQPAFDQMDEADAFWAASLASRFTDEMIAAVVKTGELSNPDAERYLTDVIIRRRNKSVAHWIALTNPLDRFVADHAASSDELSFDNAAVRLGVAPRRAVYHVQWYALDNTSGVATAVGSAAVSHTPRASIPAAAWGPADAAGLRYAVAAITTVDEAHPRWSRPVLVTVRRRAEAPEVVGIERPTGRDGERAATSVDAS